jgi:uncharacterized protein (DUF433 family)
MTNWIEHISSSPNILFGKPVIRNTRIPIDLILEKLAAGDSIEDILGAYPNISREDVVACLLFAADTIKTEIVYSKAS